jgi:hypothetical protein
MGVEYLIAGHIWQGDRLFTDGCGVLLIDDGTGDYVGDLGPGRPVGQVCPQVASGIPADVQQQAIDTPERYSGWGQTRDPNQPPSAWNGWRVWLSLLNPNRAYGPYSPPVWRAGCP